MDRLQEEHHLRECLEVIKENIGRCERQVSEMTADIQMMYSHFHDDNPEMYTELANTITMNDSVKAELKRNRCAALKPYFGRIDYHDKEECRDESLYIGKNGISRGGGENIIIDWRAPVSSIYYECELGEGKYTALGVDYDIELNRKRTYEIDEGKLIDFYDSEVVANDGLLTKYLAKNKEAVLGEIIATIQKEQNEIIRQTPFHNVLVQGVAGSGKTTVAMHRISYLLYNYRQLEPSKFFIIGSNRVLLNYITAVLPDLEVDGVQQMTLAEFLEKLLCGDVKRHRLAEGRHDNIKGGIEWFHRLRKYMKSYVDSKIPLDEIYYGGELLYSAETLRALAGENDGAPLQTKINTMNLKLKSKITNYLSSSGFETLEPEEKRKIISRYNNHFGPRRLKCSIEEIYKSFLETAGLEVRRSTSGKHVAEYDIYDLASLLYIGSRIHENDLAGEACHVVIDEAQDFGDSVYAVLGAVLTGSTFTVMGDVSQNINYYSGMNDWETLRNEVFNKPNDYFAVLSKSYRNTIEISEYAREILKKGSGVVYETQPIIRHGNAVAEQCADTEAELVETAGRLLGGWKETGYETIAVICHDEDEAKEVAGLLSEKLEVNSFEGEASVFGNGISVLPIRLAKGLEFDAVMLWNPTEKRYPAGENNVKLLYVAATRALHELAVIYEREKSPLLPS